MGAVIKYSFVDKSEWPKRGQWDDEPDLMDEVLTELHRRQDVLRQLKLLFEEMKQMLGEVKQGGSA